MVRLDSTNQSVLQSSDNFESNYFSSLSQMIPFTYILFSMFCGFHPMDDGRWEKYAETDRFDFYIDTRSIKKTKNNHRMVWSKQKPKQESLSEIQQEQNALHMKFMAYLPKEPYAVYDSGRWRFYDHTITLYDIDCENSRERWVSVIDYEENGDILRSQQGSTTEEWEYAIPESVSEMLVHRACRRTMQEILDDADRQTSKKK
jgi:hypothetical protein